MYQWFRNSLENDKKPVSGSQVLDFKQLFNSLRRKQTKKEIVLGERWGRGQKVVAYSDVIFTLLNLFQVSLMIR